jgi:hypothetical protein
MKCLMEVEMSLATCTSVWMSRGSFLTTHLDKEEENSLVSKRFKRSRWGMDSLTGWQNKHPCLTGPITLLLHWISFVQFSLWWPLTASLYPSHQAIGQTPVEPWWPKREWDFENAVPYSQGRDVAMWGKEKDTSHPPKSLLGLLIIFQVLSQVFPISEDFRFPLVSPFQNVSSNYNTMIKTRFASRQPKWKPKFTTLLWLGLIIYKMGIGLQWGSGDFI